MAGGYSSIIANNIESIYREPVSRLAKLLPARIEGETIIFNAFGKECSISPSGITLGSEPLQDARGIIISLYILHASSEPARLEPFTAFREFENTAPYVGAFSTHTEQILVPHVEKIKQSRDMIITALNGRDAPPELGADISFVINPLPKIFLCYLIYEPDEEFPASVTCLYSNNASSFLPADGLADVGEYSSRAIIEIASSDLAL